MSFRSPPCTPSAVHLKIILVFPLPPTAQKIQNEIEHFVALVRGEETICRNPAEDGIALMEILDAIYKSAEIGGEVKII